MIKGLWEMRARAIQMRSTDETTTLHERQPERASAEIRALTIALADAQRFGDEFCRGTI
jgi:hypothetical protein